MSEQEIIEGNKLIAEFIELLPHNLFPEELSAPRGFEWMATQINTNYAWDKDIENEMEFHKYFKFHSSWDWLMPVVEKIKFIEDNQEEFFNDYHLINFKLEFFYGVELWIDKERLFLQTAFGENTLINAVYEAVIEFIKWYNSCQKEK